MADLTDEQRRALRLLARRPDDLVEQGFSPTLLRELVRDGLAEAETHHTLAGGRHVRVTLMKITAAGRKTVAE
jgi:hypothetical protein